METYIVRIYRQPEDPSQEVLGIVEQVGIGKTAAFSSYRELVDILASPGRGRRRRRSRNDERRLTGPEAGTEQTT